MSELSQPGKPAYNVPISYPLTYNHTLTSPFENYIFMYHRHQMIIDNCVYEKKLFRKGIQFLEFQKNAA